MLAATNNFLLPNATFFVELVLFLIVLFVVSKFILPPISKVIKEREAEIRSAQEQAEQGHQLMRRAESELQATLAEARQESRALVEEATRTGEQAREEMHQRAKAEYEAQIARATAEIDQASESAAGELQRQVPDLVSDAAEKVLHRDLPPELRRSLADESTTRA